MVKIQASFSVVGKGFSPAIFSQKKSVKLIDAHEAGEIGNIGRYKGKPLPYGHATIEISDKAEEDWSRFDELLTVMEGCIEALREAGAEVISLSCSLFHDGQCNFGFSAEELRRLSSLNIDMSISCYSDEIE